MMLETTKVTQITTLAKKTQVHPPNPVSHSSVRGAEARAASKSFSPGAPSASLASGQARGLAAQGAGPCDDVQELKNEQEHRHVYGSTDICIHIYTSLTQAAVTGEGAQRTFSFAFTPDIRAQLPRVPIQPMACMG